MAEIYVENRAYKAVVDTLAAKTGADTDDIKTALGEEGNIWPESIRKGTTNG